MKGCTLIIAAALALGLALLGLAVVIHETSSTTQAQRAAALSYAQARDAQDLADRAANADRAAQLWRVWQPAIAGVGFALLLLLPAGVALGAMELQREIQHRRALVRPDARGLLAVPLDRLAAGHYDHHAAAALGGWHVSQAEAARNPPLPAAPEGVRQVRYDVRPATAQRITGRADDAPALTVTPTAAPAALPPAMPLSMLLRAGHRPTADRLLLGMSGASPIWTPPGAHVAIAGPTGAGKDHAARLLLTQVVAAVPGCDAMILDPHHVWTDAADGTDLTPLQEAGVAAVTGKGEIAGMLEWLARSELERRIKARQEGKESGPPRWVLVNEAPSVLQDYPDTARHIRALVNEGRKFRLFLLLASQDFLAATVRESSIRAQLTTAVNLGADPYTARALGVVPPPGTGSLGKGVAYVRAGQTPPTLARVPLVDAQGIRALLPPPPTAAPSPSPWTVIRGGGGGGGGGEDGDSDPESDTQTATTGATTTTTDPDQARRERIRELHAQGVSRSSICHIVFGYKDVRTMGIVAAALEGQATAGDG